MATSPDGRTVWVTARGSDALPGFSASRLATPTTPRSPAPKPSWASWMSPRPSRICLLSGAAVISRVIWLGR